MKFGSVCSGIEAASVAWEPLGWKPAFLSEIEKFPRGVLSHHYPDVPLHGDFTTIGEREYGAIDLLVGGTPCQSFSIAGLRKGLADDRGNLALEYLRLAQRKRPQWLVWENVPGVLSSGGGRDFGAFLGGLVELGYGFSYRVLDAQHFGVPQRRRRVFVVGYFGDWRPAAAVLFERHCLQGNTPPRRKAVQDLAATLDAGIGRRRGSGMNPSQIVGTLTNDGKAAGSATLQHAEQGLLQACRKVAHGEYVEDAVSSTAKARDAKGDADLVTCVTGPRTHALTAEGHDASEDGTGRGTPIIAFSCKDNGRDAANDIAPTLRSMNGARPNGGGQLAVAFAENSRSELRLEGGDGQRAGALSTGGGKPGQGTPTIAQGNSVRRLTPTECERLQGFPDGYTQIPWRNKTPENCPDGPRYKALGNSMAVPVMRWIGERLQAAIQVA